MKLGDKVSEGPLIPDADHGGERAPSARACRQPRPKRRLRPRRTFEARADGGVLATPAPGGRRMRDDWCSAPGPGLSARVPLRRSGHEDRARRALRRRSAACASTSAASRPRRCCTSPLSLDEWRSARRPRHGVRQAEARSRQAARLEGQGGRQADRRPRRHGEGAQGRGRARRRALRRPDHLEVEPSAPAGEVRRQEGRPFREGDHRCRQPGGEAAVHSRRPAHRRFDRRARAAQSRSGCS